MPAIYKESETQPLSPIEWQKLQTYLQVQQEETQRMLDSKKLFLSKSLSDKDKYELLHPSAPKKDDYRITLDGQQVGVIDGSRMETGDREFRVEMRYMWKNVENVLIGQIAQRRDESAEQISHGDNQIDGQTE